MLWPGNTVFAILDWLVSVVHLLPCVRPSGGGTEYLWPGETHWQYLPKDCVATRLNGLSGRGCVCLWLIDVLKQHHYGLQAGIIQSDSFLFKWKWSNSNLAAYSGGTVTVEGSQWKKYSAGVSAEEKEQQSAEKYAEEVNCESVDARCASCSRSMLLNNVSPYTQYYGHPMSPFIPPKFIPQ